MYSAPLPAYVALRFPVGSTKWVTDTNSLLSYLNLSDIKNLCWSLATLPAGCGSATAWTLFSSSQTLPLPLQEDGLPCGPVLQGKVTDSSAEVLCFGVPCHGFGVAKE